MYANELSTIPAGLVGAGLPAPGGLWGMLGSEILASSAVGDHGPGLAANDSLNPALRYIYALESRSNSTVLLYPDSSHQGLVPYSGTVRLYEQGTGEVVATVAARTFSVSAALAAPVITVQPQAQSATDGGFATFTATVTGSGLSYQWRRAGVNIPGATGASYTLTAQLADNGVAFALVVSNSAGFVLSDSAVLSVQSSTVAPAVVTHPQGQTVTAGQLVTFTAAFSGVPSPALQWLRNGSAVPGATSASYSFTAGLADSGAAISCRATNAGGSVTTAVAVLSVQAVVTSAPVIIAQPQSATHQDGETAVFSVQASGAAPLSYAWARDGVPVSGANGPTLWVSNVSLLDNRAAFQVTVSNAVGQVTSRRVVLLVPVVGLEEARTAARVDDDRFNSEIPRWIDNALSLAEQFCNRYFSPKAPSFSTDAWPAAGYTYPVSAVRSASVSYWDGAAWQTLVPNQFAFWAEGNRTGLAPAVGTSWPALGAVAGGPRVRVSFAAGPTRSADLPIEVRHFILAHVSLWADENRAAAPQAAQNFPWLYAGLEPLKDY
jgi:hypothetical protein